MKKYNKPELEIITFVSEDIIRTSATEQGAGGDYDSGRDAGFVQDIFDNP